MLQYLLQQWIRQQAQQRLMEAVAQAAQGRPGRQEEDEEGAPPPPVEVAIVLATNVEAAGIVDAAGALSTTKNATFIEHRGGWQERQVLVAETGLGCAAAAKGTADLIAVHRPAWVVSAGFATALSDELPRGHIVMPDLIVADTGREFAVDFQVDEQSLAQAKKLHVGRLVTVSEAVKRPAERRELAAKFAAVACDTETAAVAGACLAAQTRFMSVRIISDAVDDVLPREVEKLASSKTLARQLGVAAGAILNRPGALKDLWQLREDAIKYSDRLAKFLAGVVRQLA